MSDQEKNIKDEELDKVSGGAITDPHIVERNPVSGPHSAPGRDRGPQTPIGDRIDPV